MLQVHVAGNIKQVTTFIYLAWAMNVIKLEGKVRGRVRDRRTDRQKKPDL